MMAFWASRPPLPLVQTEAEARAGHDGKLNFGDGALCTGWCPLATCVYCGCHAKPQNELVTYHKNTYHINCMWASE